MLHYRLCFLQCDWRLENSPQKASTLMKSEVSVKRHQTLSSRVGSGHKTMRTRLVLSMGTIGFSEHPETRLGYSYVSKPLPYIPQFSSPDYLFSACEEKNRLGMRLTPSLPSQFSLLLYCGFLILMTSDPKYV